MWDPFKTSRLRVSIVDAPRNLLGGMIRHIKASKIRFN